MSCCNKKKKKYSCVFCYVNVTVSEQRRIQSLLAIMAGDATRERHVTYALVVEQAACSGRNRGEALAIFHSEHLLG